MHNLATTRPELLHLFDSDTPAMPMLFSILEGKGPGEILVDDPAQPTQCIVRSRVGMTFAGPHTTQAFLDETLARLRLTGNVLLVGPQGDDAWSAPEPDRLVERLEFRSFDKRHVGFLSAVARPLEGVRIREIGSEQFDDCLWRDMLLAFCGSKAGFLSHGLGLSLLAEDELLAEAYAPVAGNNVMEIGVITAEPHRKKGYATWIAAHVIRRCLDRGQLVSWSCETDNPASTAIARKLGFVDERTYPVYGLRSTQP